MRRPYRGSIAAAVAGVLALTSFNLGSAQAASAPPPPRVQAGGTLVSDTQASGTVELSARKRHRHYRRGNSRAALQMFGMVLGTIAAIAAAEEARRYRHRHGYYRYYGYPPPPYGYNGYGPYYHYRYYRY